jgi:hypothetical protein
MNKYLLFIIFIIIIIIIFIYIIIIIINYRPLEERRKMLEQNMTEIPGRIMFSEQKIVKVNLFKW